MKARLALLAIALIVGGACSVAPHNLPPDDHSSDCPDGYRHIDIEPSIWNHAGDMLEGRPLQIVIVAASLDPDYQGVLTEGGPIGHNPIVREFVIPEQGTPYKDPNLCIPPDKAVAITVRVAMQHPHEAYEEVECELSDRGIALGGRVSNPQGLAGNQLAYDKVQVQLDDLIDKDKWYIAQCGWVFIPDAGAPGGVPTILPRPDGNP